MRKNLWHRNCCGDDGDAWRRGPFEEPPNRHSLRAMVALVLTAGVGLLEGPLAGGQAMHWECLTSKLACGSKLRGTQTEHAEVEFGALALEVGGLELEEEAPQKAPH